MTADEIAQEIVRRAWSFGVSVWLSPDDHVQAADMVRCSGYFDGESKPPVLAVSWGQPEDRRIGVLLHEYSHLTQWAEGAPIWKDDTGDWAAWLNGKSVRNIKALIANARELEADCERRTIRLMRELQAPVDLERYTRSANAYLHFYNVMAERRKWFAKDKSPYTQPDVLALCNPTLDTDFSKTPPKLWAAIEACL